jgi:hypothetical protein
MDPNVKEFLRYVLSREGQAEVMRDGKYRPLTAAVVREQLAKLDQETEPVEVALESVNQRAMAIPGATDASPASPERRFSVVSACIERAGLSWDAPRRRDAAPARASPASRVKSAGSGDVRAATMRIVS